MSRQIQLRRGSAVEHDSFVGAIGEITVDTTNWTLRVHDGITLGGHIITSNNNTDYVIESQLPTADNAYTWYRKYNSGWIEQGGINDGTGVITLPVAMANAHYTAIAMPRAFGSYENVGCLTINLIENSKSTTSFNVQIRWNGGGTSNANAKFDWIVYGIAG